MKGTGQRGDEFGHRENFSQVPVGMKGEEEKMDEMIVLSGVRRE